MPALFENRAKELTNFLVARGYQHKFVCDQIQKVRGMDREKLIKRNTQPPCDRIPFTVTYHPCLPNIGKRNIGKRKESGLIDYKR